MRSLSEFRDNPPRLVGLKFCLVSFLVVPLAPALSWELGRGATYHVYEVAKEGACQSGYKKPQSLPCVMYSRMEFCLNLVRL